MMRKIFCLLAVCTVTLCLSSTSHAAVVGYHGYQSTTLYRTFDYETAGGLDLYNGQLYFGQYDKIQSLNPSTLADSTVGTIPTNAGNAAVIAKPDTGTIYTAYGTSYNAPSPHAMGYIDSTGTFVKQIDTTDDTSVTPPVFSPDTTDGIYDAAVAGNGQLYITANPDADNDNESDGNQVLRYDWSDGSVASIINVGGYSAGLVFDDVGDLYVGDYDDDCILKFSANDVAAATAEDPLEVGDAIMNIAFDNPNYMAVDSDYLYVNHTDSSYPYTAHIERIDLTDTSQRLTITDGAGGKMVADGDGNLYTIDTDWDYTSPTYYTSSIEFVTSAVPEPSTIVLLLAGLASLVMLRRR